MCFLAVMYEPKAMLLCAMTRASCRAASMWAGLCPGQEPQYTQMVVRFLFALGFRVDGVEVLEAGIEGMGDAPPDSIVDAPS